MFEYTESELLVMRYLQIQVVFTFNSMGGRVRRILWLRFELCFAQKPYQDEMSLAF